MAAPVSYSFTEVDQSTPLLAAGIYEIVATGAGGGNGGGANTVGGSGAVATAIFTFGTAVVLNVRVGGLGKDNDGFGGGGGTFVTTTIGGTAAALLVAGGGGRFFGGGGGGGGYNGGSSGNSNFGGDGGSSFAGSTFLVAGTSTQFSNATTRADGSVTITFLTLEPPTLVPEPASLALLGCGVAGLAAMLRRRAA